MLSLSMIELCRKSMQPRTHGPSRISLSSNISNMQSFQGHANLKQEHSKQIDLRNKVKGMKSVTTIMLESATGMSLPVMEDMSALPASSQAMSQEARSAKRLEEAIHHAEQPGFARDLLWDDAEISCLSSPMRHYKLNQ